MINNICKESKLRQIVTAYLDAKKFVINSGFVDEINWQEQLSFEQLTESKLIREAAWVVLSSGMRESVIKMKFNSLSSIFYEWECANTIAKYKNKCRNEGLKIFNNAAKIDAIIAICTIINNEGFLKVRTNIEKDGIQYIRNFPFMGPATSYHFAKNIGLQFAKPDRHLNRITDLLGYAEVHQLCKDVAIITGDAIPVIDLVFWRYATLNSDYKSYFSSYFN